MESTNGGKTKLIVIAIIIIVAVALFMWSNGMQPAVAPAPVTSEVPAAVTSNSLTQMQNDAATVDAGNLDTEFQTIDKDVNSL
jgi:hypothetical protein